LDAVVSGNLNRQRQTAAAARDACIAAGGTMQAAEVDAGWDEFDLAAVYAGIGPQIAASDQAFAREWDAMQQAVAASREDHKATVHRKWNDCDRKVVMAWVEAHYDYTGETFAKFRERILGAFERTVSRHLGKHVAVFTSATPIGICAADTFALKDGRALQFAAVLHNAAISTIRMRSDELRLFTFNSVAHLAEAHLRTFR
jgi:broad specificity phosphatase PhoE